MLKPFTSIKVKFSRNLLLLSILPLLIVGLFSGLILFHALKSNYIQFADYFTKETQDETDSILNNALRIQEQISSDFSIQQTLQNTSLNHENNQDSIDTIIISRLDSMQLYTDNIYEISIVGNNNSIYSSNFHISYFDNLSQTDWYNQIITSDDPIWFAPHDDSFIGTGYDISLLTVGFTIRDNYSKEVLGVVLVDIDMFDLQMVYNKKFLNDGYAFLLTPDEQILVNPSMLTPSELELYYQAIEERPYIYMYNEQYSAVSDFSTLSIIQYDTIFSDTLSILLIVMALTLILSFATIIISRRMAQHISKPITQLTELMTSVQTGNLNVYMNIESNDEVGILAEKFNDMIQEIDHYTKKEILDIKKLQKAELETLQSQINPHFLYNTLDSVVWMARTGINDQVIRMVSALTVFFRLSLSKGQETITIETEKQHLESYLTIQSMRYSSILNYTIDIPEKYLQYYMPKILLQPLVENSIYHGIKLMDRQGHITISVTDDQKNLYFHIADTGLGMTSEMLNKINDVCKTANGKSINSYGVINVSRRMQILFGSEYYPHFSSILEQGTTVTIPIPKQWEIYTDD
ncbi:MAG: sensor histidine kinase [Eubacteriales bacterium]